MSIAYVVLFAVLASIVVSVLYATWQPASKKIASRAERTADDETGEGRAHRIGRVGLPNDR
jgi:hypothetical protein